MRVWIHNWIKLALSLGLGASMVASLTGQLANSIDDEIVERFAVTGQKIEGLLEILAELTDRSILRPQSLPTPEITFDSGGPISKRELILAIESLLSLNGIGVSPLGDRFLKVVPLATIRTEAPELVTTSLADRNPSGQVVSKLFRLQYLDSQTFQQQIQPFLSPGFSSIIPFQNSNAVIVTDTVSNLQRLEYVVSEVDKPSRLNIETTFITLQFARASEVAQQIQQMIEDARSRFGGPAAQGPAGQRGPGATRNAVPGPEMADAAMGAQSGDAALSMQVLFGSNTAISADDRTNQLIIMTEPGNLRFFEDMIEKLDITADPATRIDVIPLKHANAEEVASLLSQFVSGRTRTDSSDATVSSNRGSRQPRLTFPDQANQTVESQRPNAAPGGSAAEDRDSQFSTFMTILADERSNSLVISGTRSDLELITQLVDNIDVLLAQVRIEVVIAEVNLGKNRQLTRGMDAFNIEYTRDEAGEEFIETEGFNIFGLGLNGLLRYEDGNLTPLTLDAVFSTARSNNDVRLLSIPTIVTTHNREATIIVGEARPIITSSQTDSSITNSVRSQVQFRDIGIELIVTPLIGPNNVIQLEIDQKVDDIIGSDTIDGNEQPIISRRQATSYLGVRDGEVVVLGGLQRQNNNKSRASPTFLGEIPLVGRLFSRRGNSFDTSELMVFIRPKILRDTDAVYRDALEKSGELRMNDRIHEFLETGRVSVTEDEDATPEFRGRR